jgi:uncharacterized protein with ATP-grasp and redox domains
MLETSLAPPRIRTDATHAFAHHTMKVRVPVIIEEVIARNPHYSPAVLASLQALAADLRNDAPLPAPLPGAPDSATWLRELELRRGESWLDTDWFFAETYAYRQLVERTQFFENAADPFAAHKREEYESRAYDEAFAGALTRRGSRDELTLELLARAVFGNRIDLSFAASRAHGAHVTTDDLLLDDRAAALARLFQNDGALHVIADNAGTELTLDLVLIDFLLQAGVDAVTLHVKVHPTFVSDAIVADVDGFLRQTATLDARVDVAAAKHAFFNRMTNARASGRLEVLPHPFWNGPLSLWQLPNDLVQRFSGARLVLLKGDANYRRALGDARWPPATRFQAATSYFPAPLLALRTLKSDAIVGLPEGQAEALDASDPSWRVNGRRALISLGGRAP